MNNAPLHNRLAPSRTAFAVTGLVLLFSSAAACNGPRRIHEEPVIYTGDRVTTVDDAVADARMREAGMQQELQRRQDSVRLLAMSDCVPTVCAAVQRGDVQLGMNEAQVLAASGTSPDAWTIRRTTLTTVLSPVTLDAPPRDANGTLAMVQLTNGRVSSVSWRERTGLRVVSAPSDTTAAVRAKAQSRALIAEGDDFVAAGDRTRALERYDRALVLQGDDAMLNYKVAQLLDQQLRPVEALMRYQRFLQQMELERIEAVGTQHAKLAEAIALAQQRVLVLDRRTR